MKPVNNTKRRKRKLKARKSPLKDKDSLKMKIAKAAKSCKDIEDLKLMLEPLLNENNHLEYGNTEIKLDMNKDALDQMIEQNCFHP
jgi:regulator of replication initiation timing